MCHDRPVTFSLCLFYFFFGNLIFKIWESEHKLGLIAFLQRGPQLRDDPVSHFRLLHTIPEVDSILTRISATFLVAEREVSQNGN
jgi:hypothetical protein